MEHLGWVMFGKAVIVAVWLAIVERWAAYRRRRREQGLPMRQRRDGVYVVSDWTEAVDRAFIFARETLFWLWAAFMTFLLGGWAVLGKEAMGRLLLS